MMDITVFMFIEVKSSMIKRLVINCSLIKCLIGVSEIEQASTACSSS